MKKSKSKLRDEAPMIVTLREIPPEGLRMAFDLSGPWAERTLAETDADPNASRLRTDVVLTRSHTDVVVNGTLSGVLIAPCARCTAPSRLAVDAPFHVLFIPAPDPREAPAGDLELGVADLDVGTYTDDEVDLDGVLREQVLLAVPMAPLCREDCRGLCPRCGAELKQGPCSCPPAPKDDRWAALKDIKA